MSAQRGQVVHHPDKSGCTMRNDQIMILLHHGTSKLMCHSIQVYSTAILSSNLFLALLLVEKGHVINFPAKTVIFS